jgi:glycosyltransferase involved in cell wall biosynthesis
MLKFVARNSILLHLILLSRGIDTLGAVHSGQELTHQRPFSYRRDKVKRKKRILIVGMNESPHLHTWIDGIEKSGIVKNIWLLPSDFPVNKIVNSKIDVMTFPFFGFGKVTNFLFRALDFMTNRLWRTYVLSLMIRILKPSHLHFHETQHAAYLFNPIANHPKLRFKGKLIVSTWGSDLQLYGRLSSHIQDLKDVAAWAHLITSERTIDEDITNDLGFRGEFRAPVYITLGMDPEISALRKTSERNLILIKGYQDDHGRALNALAAIEMVSQRLDLSVFEFRVFSASSSVAIQAEYLNDNMNLNVQVIPKLPKKEMLELFKDARAYIGLAISDGLSTSMAEAMTFGAFPIQSKNSSASVLITNRVNGGKVDPWDLKQVCESLELALFDDDLVDKAAQINREVIQDNYNLSIGVQRLAEIYE